MKRQTNKEEKLRKCTPGISVTSLTRKVPIGEGSLSFGGWRFLCKRHLFWVGRGCVGGWKREPDSDKGSPSTGC